MPHINRIRVNNVKYNFGTQSYDDFIMRLSGKNTIYDLANGGGKSILMLLLLQNMLPNCTLDEKQPIEKLFRAGNDNKVIHSLVEWKLNPSHIKDGFAYMTTGFCARKAKDTADEEQRKDTASIEYFNYCIFYREFNDNDIINLPLVKDEERITYMGLKNYLRELGKKDFSLQVHVFDRKGDYQRFIRRYGIYESEWELIRGINKTEGHVRTFFETHYKSTRKIVEDLLIEEIIEKSYQNRLEHEENTDGIANTLLDIKDKLVELTRKKEEIDHFDHQIEALHSFSDRLYSLKTLYSDKAEMEKQLILTYNTACTQLGQLNENRKAKEQNTLVLQRKLTDIEKETARSKIAVEEAWLRDLEHETSSLQLQCRQLEEEAQEKEAQLNLYEAGNDYFEYLENKKQMEIQKNAVFDIANKNGDLLEELQALAGNLLALEQKERQNLESESRQLEETLRDKKAGCASLDIQLRELDKQLAVIEKEEQELSSLTKTQENELEAKRQLSGLSIVEEAQARLNQATQNLQRLHEQQQFFEQQYHKLQKQIMELELKKSSDEQKRFALEERLEDMQALLMRQENERQKLKELETVYGKQGEELYADLEREFENRIARLSVLQKQRESEQNRLDCLQNQESLPNDDVLRLILDYIHRHYDEHALSGSDYLNSLSKEEQKNALEAVPFLCHAILMDARLEEAMLDQTLKAKIPDARLLVILPKSEVLSGSYLYTPQNLRLLSSDSAFLYDEELRVREINRQKQKNEEQDALNISLADSVNVLRQDLFFLHAYLRQGADKYEETRQNYDRLKEEYYQTLQALEEFQSSHDNLSAQQMETELSIQQTERQKAQLVQETALLKELSGLYDALITTDKKAQEKKELLQRTRREYEETRTLFTKEQKETEETAAALKAVQEQLQQIKQNCLIYEPYHTQKEYPQLSLEKTELEQIFLGKQTAFEEKNTDVSDKQRMAELYKNAMAKNEAAIKYRHFTMKDLELLAQNHKLRTMSTEDLEQAKQQAERCKRRLTDASKEYTHKQSQCDRQQGSVRHAVQSYEENFQEEYVSLWQKEDHEPTLKQLQILAAEGAARLKSAKQESAGHQESVKRLEKQCAEAEIMVEELLRLIENLELKTEQYTGQLEESENLSAAYANIRRSYDKLVNQEGKCRESFEQDKAQLIQTLNLLKATDLAMEISRQLKKPKDEQEVKQYIENIEQTVNCIHLEKARISQSIEHMEIMKENFEKQCLQICLSIREALERLPKLSSIQLDEKPTGMLRLQIPYIEESLYQDALGHYIDQIIQNADGLETSAERLKYIRGQLAWKRLFSVIVKDMDKIKLLLYKRERMKEQSRYLKYEEAVGSAGQSQGIYIQFLVAIINYISSLNGSQDTMSLQRKALFIDNPFGAAKDVYIWEPIFKMLKSNHVQLIVPARGASPAIMGRFEVNYLLGQKLINGRQQTVVVDYRSQVDEDIIEYRELEFSQPTFNFTT